MAYVASTIYVSGLNEAIAGLRAMGAEKELLALNTKVGEMVVREAKQLVPVKSGALQGSIKTVRSSKVVQVRAGNNGKIPYANVQNYGWFYDRNNFIEKNIMPTQFMNKAANKVRAWAGKHYMEDLLKIYEKYAGKGYTDVIVPNRDILSGTERESY